MQVNDTSLPNSDAVLLETMLRDRDVPCPRCAYNLRSLTSPRCPECGDEITISRLVNRPTIINFPYTLCLMALSIGVVESWYDHWQPLFRFRRIFYGDMESQRIALIRWGSHAFWFGLLPAAFVFLFLGRWFLKRSRAVQWTIAGILWGLCILAHRRLLWIWTNWYN